MLRLQTAQVPYCIDFRDAATVLIEGSACIAADTFSPQLIQNCSLLSWVGILMAHFIRMGATHRQPYVGVSRSMRQRHPGMDDG